MTLDARQNATYLYFCIANITYFGKTLARIFFETIITNSYKIIWKGHPLEIKHPDFENRRLDCVCSWEAEHAISRTPLALRRATLCFHFNVEPHRPKRPEIVKINIHCLKTANRVCCFQTSDALFPKDLLSDYLETATAVVVPCGGPKMYSRTSI